MAGCTASSTAPPVTNGGELSPYHLEIDLLGTKSEFSADSQGKLKTNVNLSSADGKISLSLNEGTMVMDEDKKPLQVIDVAIDPNPPTPSREAYIVGAAYDLRPEGANFNPQIKLTLSYDPEELPEGVSERNVYIACYQDTGWEKLPYKNVDTESHKVTTHIDQFAKYAVLVPLPPTEHPAPDTSLGPVDRVDVVYFHRTQRCYSCKYVEAGTRYTVETYFKDELASGKVTFQVLNVEDEENAAIVKKYRAFTSSLFINTIKGGTDYIKEATDIYFLIGKDEAFVEALRSRIEKSLKGEV
jgi:hypothetical protein